MTRKFGPSWKQSTGQTSTQSVYLHLMQFSVTTNGMRISEAKGNWRSLRGSNSCSRLERAVS